MAVSATKDFWIHPNALTITLNYFDDPQLIQTSMLAGSVILAYNKNYIGYDAAHNYREWKLQAFPTQLNDTCAYYVHAELSRDGDTAMIIYSPVKRDIEGRSFIDGAWDSTTSSASWFIYLGEISSSVDADGATVERVWTDGLYTGTLATDQQRLEDAQGDWALMFQLNSATGLIDFLRTVSSATFNALTVAKNFIFGGHTFTSVASTAESGDEKKRNDATLPTTGYVQKEIEALDDHFLIKDGDDPQDVGGDVSFGGNVSVAGEHSVGGNQSIGGEQSVVGSQNIGGNQTIEGCQEVKGLQTLHEGFMTPNFNDAGGQVTGAQLTRDGLFSVAGLIANSFTIKELIYNVIRAQGGEYVFSPTVNIERCVYHMKDGRSLSPDDYYAEYTAADFANIDNVTLILRDDELTHNGNPLEVNDIVYGYVNQIGESGQHATGGQCLMHVTAINELEITAVLYQVGDRGVVANIPPAEGMTIAQRGTEDSSKTVRMTSFYISAESGSVIMLDRVQSPTLSAGNYGASFGKLPTDLLLKVRENFSYIQETDPVVYARYGIFENLLQFDHLGQPIQRENNRGEWSADETYRNLPDYYDTVTYNGSLWKCVIDGTTLPPSLENSHWLMLVAKGEDSNVAAYEIKPSTNLVYFDVKNNKLSVDKITVAVGETIAKGYVEISSQDELLDRGLTLYYSIDGGELRILNISEGGLFDMEDGSGTLELESGLSFMLEGEELFASDIKDNITIYLIDSNNVRRDLAVIPVMRAGSFKSMVFTRDASVAGIRPTGGTYFNPIPEGGKWSDGIPEGTDPVWTSYNTFYGDGTFDEWSMPSIMVDTADFEAIYSATEFASIEEAREAIPTGFNKNGVDIDADWLAEANRNGWYDEIDNPIWMATNSRSQGSTWNDLGWTVARIKGEKGDDGTSIKVKGSFDSEEELPIPPSDPSDCYIVGQDLYVWDGSAWKNVGKFKGDKGDKGEDGKDGQSIVFNLMVNTSFTKVGENGTIENWEDLSNDDGTHLSVSDNVLVVSKDATATLYRCAAQNVNGLSTDKWYTLSFYIKSGTEDKETQTLLTIDSINTDIYFDGNKFVYATPPSGSTAVPKFSATSEWVLHYLTFKPTTTDVTIGFGMYSRDSRSILLDEIKLEESNDQVSPINAQPTEWTPNKQDLIVKDGANGADAISVIAEPAILNVQVRGEDQLLINNTTHTFTVYARTATKELPTSEYDVSIPDVENYTFGTPSASNGKYSFTARLKDDTPRADIKPFRVVFTSKDGTSIGDAVITVSIAEKGLAGPAGYSGYALIQEGNYDSTKFYKLTKSDDNEKVIGKPCVYLKAQQGRGSYLILEKDMDENSFIEENGVIYPMNPNTLQRIDESDNEYWSKSTNFSMIWSEAIMANYAQFGSDKGAVFYDRFLFSQYGINKEGNFVPYTGYENVMWDDKGNLTGEFVPSLMIDMYAGYAKTNKLAETFQAYRSELYANEVNFYETYNVKCKESELKLLTTPQANDIVDGDVVLVPSQVDTRIDGVKSIILNMADRAWSRSLRATLASGSWVGSEHEEFSSFEQVLEKCMLVCGEPRLFNPYAWKYNNGSLTNAAATINDGGSTIYETGRFVIDGKFTDCIIVEPSMHINLRSCRANTQDETLYWYVENSEDFVELPYGVRIEVSSAYDVEQGNLTNVAGRYHDFGWQSYGVSYGYYQRSFVSRNVYELFKSKYGTIKENGQNFRLVVNTQPSSNAMVGENWKWEQDVIGITYEKI